MNSVTSEMNFALNHLIKKHINPHKTVIIVEMPDKLDRLSFEYYLKSELHKMGYTCFDGRHEFIFSTVRFCTIGRYELSRRDILFKRFKGVEK